MHGFEAKVSSVPFTKTFPTQNNSPWPKWGKFLLEFYCDEIVLKDRRLVPENKLLGKSKNILPRRSHTLFASKNGVLLCAHNL